MTATNFIARDGSLWQLVPVEPTPEQIEAVAVANGGRLFNAHARAFYLAGLVAGPEFREGDVGGELNRLADALSQSVRMYNESRTTMKSVANDALDVAQRLRQLSVVPEFGGAEVACPECRAAVLFECPACSHSNYP